MKLAFPCFLEYLCRQGDGKCALEPNHFKNCFLSFGICRNRDVSLLHLDALISPAVCFFNILLELLLCVSHFQKDRCCWREGMERSVFSILNVKVKNLGARKAFLKVVVSG